MKAWITLWARESHVLRHLGAFTEVEMEVTETEYEFLKRLQDEVRTSLDTSGSHKLDITLARTVGNAWPKIDEEGGG